jgi:hypothetical protein
LATSAVITASSVKGYNLVRGNLSVFDKAFLISSLVLNPVKGSLNLMPNPRERVLKRCE